jgi:hypothetical protein
MMLPLHLFVELGLTWIEGVAIIRTSLPRSARWIYRTFGLERALALRGRRGVYTAKLPTRLGLGFGSDAHRFPARVYVGRGLVFVKR